MIDTAQPSLQEAALAGLLRSGLRKRFESSAYAFSRTAQRMADSCDTFLKGLDQGVILTAEGIEEWEQSDNDEILNRLVGTGIAAGTAGHDVPRLREDVIKDRDLLHSFAERAGKVTRARDHKLAALAERLMEILKSADADGLDDKDKRNKRKVIVFSFFADTVEWIQEFLDGMFASDIGSRPIADGWPARWR